MGFIDPLVLVIDGYSNHQQLKNNLVSILEKFPDRQGRKTNVKATMTDWNIESFSSHLTDLKKYIFKTLLKNNHIQDNERVVLKYLWSNIYRKGDYTDFHDHHPEKFSFVYFLKSKWWYPSLVFPTLNRKVKPKEGRLVIFDSKLTHGVREHVYDGLRITLNGDISVGFTKEESKIINLFLQNEYEWYNRRRERSESEIIMSYLSKQLTKINA